MLAQTLMSAPRNALGLQCSKVLPKKPGIIVLEYLWSRHETLFLDRRWREESNSWQSLSVITKGFSTVARDEDKIAAK